MIDLREYVSALILPLFVSSLAQDSQVLKRRHGNKRRRGREMREEKRRRLRNGGSANPSGPPSLFLSNSIHFATFARFLSLESLAELDPSFQYSPEEEDSPSKARSLLSYLLLLYS